MEKVLVAKTLANKLFSAEDAVDEAIVKASALLSGMIEAKAQLNVSLSTADPAVAKVAEALAALSASRTAMVAAHRQLEESKLRVGIRTKMSPVGKPDDVFTPSHAELREVG